MAETSVDDLKVELRQVLANLNTGRMGSMSLSSSVQMKDLVMRCNAALARPRPAASSLRSLINEVRVFQ